jgi:hypothetical protein
MEIAELDERTALDRWVIWSTGEDGRDSMVFDRAINCPVEFDDEAARREALGRLRHAGVRETADYPGRPC